MKVVILAGGLPSTLSEERTLPKPMAELGERPLLWHIMKHYSYYGFREFIICAGVRSDIIKKYFLDYYLYQSDIEIDLETNEIRLLQKRTEDWKITVLDTGLHTGVDERILQVRDFIQDESFFINYGDVLSDIDLLKLYEQHKKNQGCVATIAVVRPAGRNSLLKIKEGFLSDTQGATEDSSAWVNSCTFVANRSVFDYLSKNNDFVSEGALFERLAHDKKAGVYYHDGFWQTVETMRDKSYLERLWEQKKAPWRLWKD